MPLVAEIESSRALLEIPAIGVHAPLVPTGAEGAPGTASLTIPDNIHTVAWWDGTVLDGHRVVHENAPSPGQPGVAVIAGHIDSAAAGPGALFDLRDLAKGDTIEIVDSLGRISNWTVSSPPETALKTNLPSALWVSNGPPKLALVTCGGPFDTATGHYLDNVIVWATPQTGQS
jgi:sortase (surface protein transpeptidase)